MKENTITPEIVKKCGVKYLKEKTNRSMCEFHVDDDKSVQDIANSRYPFGGTTLHLMPANMKPLILFGQDEAIFSQYSLNSFQWIGPKGERALLPKTTGSGIMISAFQSREFGFGLDIEEEDLRGINESRKGKKYEDKEAAIEVYEKKDTNHNLPLLYL